VVTFLDYAIVLFIGLTQGFSVYGFFLTIEKNKTDAIEWERVLRENFQNDLKLFKSGKHHEDIKVFSDRYIKERSTAMKMYERWNGRTADILFGVYLLFQFFLFAGSLALFLDTGLVE